VVSALGQTKLGTAPGYDLVYSEFLKHLGPKALTWLADLFTRMIWEQRIPKIWRQAKIMALAKPGKDPHLAASYPPVSLLRVCYKLLECTTLQRISPTVEGLLSKIRLVSALAAAPVTKSQPSQRSFRMGSRRH